MGLGGGGWLTFAGTPDGTFSLILWIYQTHPPGEEHIESIWKGETKLET